MDFVEKMPILYTIGIIVLAAIIVYFERLPQRVMRLVCYLEGHKFYKDAAMGANDQRPVRLYYCSRCGLYDKRIKVVDILEPKE